MSFKDLHNQKKPLVIANVWDVPSAKIAEELKFQAIGTSSAAIAAMLCYRDGQEITFPELLYIVKRISSGTALPLSVDLEAGYSLNTAEIIQHIQKLADLGIVGINLEDSTFVESRALSDAQNFTKIIDEIANAIQQKNMNIFLNIRTDTFLVRTANTIEETKIRIHLYEAAGANGIFVPGIREISSIKQIVRSTSLPINVMYMPDIMNFNALRDASVKRISMGDILFDRMYKQFKTDTQSILVDKTFNNII